MNPWSIEVESTQVFLLVLGSNVVSLLLWMSAGYNIPFGSVASIVVLSPIFFVLHANRRNMAEKRQLLLDLENFDLNDVDCRLESWSCSIEMSRAI